MMQISWSTQNFHRLWHAALMAAIVLTSGCNPPPENETATSGILVPAAAGSAEPHLSKGPNGVLVLSWLEPTADGVALRYSMLGEDRWAAPRTVAQSDSWFVNWADFPSVTPITDELWAAHWLARRPGGSYAYDVAIAVSTDAGATWGKRLTPHSDGTSTEHGFVTLFPWQSGIGAVWLDGRNMAQNGNSGAHGDDSSGNDGMTLRSAVIEPSQSVTNDQVVDGLVCDCCQTDVAIADSGPIAVYRNRTSEEVRDIYVSRAIEGRWQADKPIANDGWVIAGCPVNGPAIAADGPLVAVAWFTAANGTARVRFARSADSGQTFQDPIEIDLEQPVGRVDVEIMPNGTAAISWLSTSTDRQGELSVRLVSTAGDLGPVHTIAQLQTARLSGFPQMVRDGNDLVFAWTDLSADETAVKSARVAIAALGATVQ